MRVETAFAAAMETLDPKSGILVALSGGADSVCLLSLCADYAKEKRIALGAAHLNHGLRGKAADADARFCEELCKAYGIPFYTKTADVSAVAAAEKCSIETAARQVRYAFFDEVLAQEPVYDAILTAHQQNDVCETMLFHLARGSGLDGLCSIPQRRGKIFRPLLAVSRADILEYDRAHGLAFVEDESNGDLAYSRNRIRHTVLPALVDGFPAAAENMARAAKLLAADAAYLDGEAEQALAACKGARGIDTDKAKSLPVVILSRVLRKVYTAGGFSDLSAVQTEALCDLIRRGNRNFTLNLTACDAVCRGGLLRFVPKIETVGFELPLTEDRPVELPCGTALLLTTDPSPRGYEDFTRVRLAKAACIEPLAVRSRRAGDVLRRFNKTHKLKRLIGDAKCAADEKAKLFLLTSGGRTLYLRGIAIADEAFCGKEGEPPAKEPIYIFFKDKGDAICEKTL